MANLSGLPRHQIEPLRAYIRKLMAEGHQRADIASRMGVCLRTLDRIIYERHSIRGDRADYYASSLGCHLSELW